MKNIILITVMMSSLLFACHKDSPSPSGNSNGSNNSTAPTPKCGDLSLSVTYTDGNTYTDKFSTYFLFTKDITTSYSNGAGCATTSSWIHNNFLNALNNASGPVGYPVINESYFKTLSFPQKFEIGDANDNTTTPTKLTFVVEIGSGLGAMYRTGQDMLVENPDNTTTDYGISDLTNNYMQITSVKLDNRDSGVSGLSYNDASTKLNNQNCYIVTGTFSGYLQGTHNLVTGTFTTQMLVQLGQ